MTRRIDRKVLMTVFFMTLGTFIVLFSCGLVIHALEYDVLASGECGENLTWNVYINGCLNISGDGNMDDYDKTNLAPWTNYSEKITSIKIGNDVSYIGNMAFKDMDSLSSIDLGRITSIGCRVFENCSQLRSIEIPSTLTTFPHESEKETAFYKSCIAQAVFERGIVQIPQYAFSKCESLSSVSIPYGVTCVGAHAFAYSGLQSVNLPETVEKLEYGAFTDCFYLKTVNGLENVKKIGAGCFYNCHYLSGIQLNSVEEIKASAFSNCRLDEELYLPGTLNFGYDNSSDWSCFDYWSIFSNSDVKRLYLGEGMTVLPYECFRDMRNLEYVYIPESVSYIQQFAFRDCNRLVYAVVPAHASDNEQSNTDFEGCNSIKCIEYAAGSEHIVKPMSSSVTVWNVPSGVKYVHGAAATATKGWNLKDIYIPESVISIDPETFLYTYNGENGIVQAPLPDLKVYGRKGSTAETCCAEKGVSFVEVSQDDVFIQFNATFGDAEYYCAVKKAGHSYESLPFGHSEDYEFLGWFTDPFGGDKITEEDIVGTEEVLTLYAHWTGRQRLISFETGCDDIIEPMNIRYGDNIGVLPIPNKEGYRFLGWRFPDNFIPVSLQKYVSWYVGGSTNTTTTTSYNSTLIPGIDISAPYLFSEDKTLAARWYPKQYTVYFDLNGGSGKLYHESATVYYDEKYDFYQSTPTHPDNLTFLGWYTEPDGGERIFLRNDSCVCKMPVTIHYMRIGLR